MLLVDGGILNNYPVDVVKRMGADIVIGISFEKDEKLEKDASVGAGANSPMEN